MPCKSKRKSSTGSYKWINGKMYKRSHSEFKTKTKAQKSAKSFRKIGYPTRTLKVGKLWYNYYRER